MIQFQLGTMAFVRDKKKALDHFRKCAKMGPVNYVYRWAKAFVRHLERDLADELESPMDAPR